mmetsp:Transcript_22668/g.68024  ORF Transcript_22668/g.68024 Transcript_22668/m.68024 type:complete len:507 (-) Transcript_22668:539-2059(-)
MIIERKRLDDLEGALKQAEEQIKIFRISTKKIAIDLLNQHRFTAKPGQTRTDGIDPSKLAETSRKKIIASFEHRLNKMRIRLSQAENLNEKLKSEINSLRRHRMTSNKSHEKIELSIRDLKQRVEAVLERSRNVSETREGIVEQLHYLNMQQSGNRERFSKQMKSLAQFIDVQNREFEESMAAAAMSTSQSDLEGPLVRGLMNIEEEKMKAELVEELTKQIDNENGAVRATRARISLYRKSFDELKSVSGIDDLKEIVCKYVKSEEETFSLFNYIQAQNQETDWTLERHARLEEEINAYEEKLSVEEAQRAETMANLQGKWRNAKEATDECTHAAQEAQRTLERIAKKVQSLFFKIQCDQLVTGARGTKANDGAPKNNIGRPDCRLALLSGQGVAESNILAYAELIEQRALEIMSEYARRMNHHEQNHVIILEASRSLKSVNQHNIIKPPDVDGEDDEEDNEDGLPIALEEMRRRTAERICKISQNLRLGIKRKGQIGKKKNCEKG